MDYQKWIDEQKPQVILLGNSILINAIDEPKFESLTGLETYKFAIASAASAQYYLILKNIIATDDAPPKYLLLFFLDNLLTRPDLWVIGGNLLERIDEIAGENETVLLQKAYLYPANTLEDYLNSHFPVFGERQSLKDKIDNRLKYTLPWIFLKCAKPCLEKNVDMIFKDMLPHPITPISIELDNWSGKEWDFNAIVENSFIPDIIQITREKGINLILVREKNARVMDIEDETPDMHNYFEKMKEYLIKEGIPYIDLAHDPVLTRDMFQDEMHLQYSARFVFTQLVAERFLTLLK